MLYDHATPNGKPKAETITWAQWGNQQLHEQKKTVCPVGTET